MDYIVLLFDKFIFFFEGVLRIVIEELVVKILFFLIKIYIVEGFKRSFYSNVYFYGFFKNKRIVLFDILLVDNFVKNEDNEGEDGKENVENKENEDGNLEEKEENDVKDEVM